MGDVTRRTAIPLGIAGIAALAGHAAGEEKAKEGGVEAVEQPEIRQLRTWLPTLVAALPKVAGEDAASRAIQECGRDCARRSCGADMQKMKESLKEPGSVDELVALMAGHNSADRAVEKKDGAICVTYRKCFCGIRRSGLVTAPEFCECTKGWAREFFESVLGKPVEVTLSKAIGRGDAVCETMVRVRPEAASKE